MTDILQTAVASLAATIKSDAAGSITYTRGGQSVTLSATIGQTEFNEQDTEGFITRVESQDFIVTAEDLVLDSTQTLPRKGDVITRVDPDGATRTYDVLPVDGEKCYRLTRGVLLRIHTKQTKVSS